MSHQITVVKEYDTVSARNIFKLMVPEPCKPGLVNNSYV